MWDSDALAKAIVKKVKNIDVKYMTDAERDKWYWEKYGRLPKRAGKKRKVTESEESNGR